VNVQRTGISVVCAIGLALAGLSQSLCAQTNVTFTDSKLEAAVRSALSKPSGPLTFTDLQTLLTLSAASQGIQGLSGLEAATNLRTLSLPNNSISDLKPLRSMAQLQQLTLNQNLISDLSPLASCTNLNYLELRRNFVTNSTALAACIRLNTLYLGGNAIRDLAFVRSLGQLQFLDLDRNSISDLSLLSTLTNLGGLDLGYNPVTNLTALGGLSNLSRLYLSGNSLSSVDALTNLTGLTSLTLYSNRISDVSVLRPLSPHLSDLGLSWNPLTNLSGLSAFTNLSSLWLDGDNVADLNWASALPGLQALGLQHIGLGDLSVLNNLTNLMALHADYNRLNDLGVLVTLPQLSWLGLVGNLMNTNVGSTALGEIQALQTGGVTVSYIPQAQKPCIKAPSQWFIRAGATSTTSVDVSDALTPAAGLAPGISSSNLGLLPESNIGMSWQPGNLNLSVTPATNQAGTTLLSLGVTNEAGLSSSVIIEVVVVSESVVQVPDPNLEAALRLALGKPAGALTILDLLGLKSLFVYEPGITNLSVLESATNLTELLLIGASVDLMPISKCAKLRLLSLYGTSVGDLSPLTNLTSLNNLDLSWTEGSNYDIALSQLTNLTSLDLVGNSISSIAFLRNLQKLVSLDLADNKIINISSIGDLTNLSWLSLEQNLVTDITPLQALVDLLYFDTSLNLLDLSANSPNLAVFSLLQGRGASLIYSPQRSAPVLTLPTQWFMAKSQIASIPFTVSDNAVYPPGFIIAAQSSNTNVIPNESLIASSSTNGVWLLTVSPFGDRIGTTTITLTVTNDAGLGIVGTFPLTALNPQPVTLQDTRLQNAILSAMGRSSGSVSTVDLLDLTGLNLDHAGISNLSGLQWATNIVWLDLDDNSLSDLTPLTNLFRLTWISASNNFIANTSALVGLTNLQYVNLSENLITNLSAFFSGFPALTQLYLSGNAVADLSFLTNLTELAVLDLSQNDISDASKLGALTNLSALSLRSNQLTNIQFLTRLIQLTNLDLGNNLIIDASPLSALYSLGQLSLQQNLLTNILPLQTMTSLYYLDIGLNQLDLGTNSTAKAVINNLQSAMVSVAYLPQLPLDSDGDGMPDDWELAHGLNPHDPSDALADPDGDGRSNLMEYALGSDPHNPADGNSGIIVSLFKQGGSTYLSMQFVRRTTPVWPRYIVEVSDGIGNWYSDSSHVQTVNITSINAQFDQVTVADLSPVTISSGRGIRLRIVTR
jgi:Leucine-rich repeat (LRR) protein